ncbi:unnamed protein product [Pseudo-nitzschia multistriata]|uniref:Uncharacterized protein n=1 Tax=Pseudo-nitzschia multistriata TaxID=183589 RepID=A0A448YYA3_9STRA|nr:unnamed protein product [Pseudo-nitzschia multistriata]
MNGKKTMSTTGTKNKRKEYRTKVISFHNHRKSLITYEAFVWIVFGITTTLAIIDRFTTNFWPRQMFSIGQGSAGTDRLVGFKPGPWSVVAYDVIARISGRFSICAYNLLLITRLRCLEHCILCSKWVNRMIDCSNIIKANLRLHKWNGIALCVLTFIHVWSILFPCVFHGYTAKVIRGTFEWPLSERPPPGFKDADAVNKQMGLEIDDVWRMVEMTVMFCILLPLSVRWFSTRWHIGMPLHRLINVLYFVDIVRRHTHPHSWVLNTPIFCAWVFDKFWMWYSNRRKGPEVHRTYLGENYMVLYWKHCETKLGSYDALDTHPILSPDYFLRLDDSSFFESAHVFTCFENRTNTSIDRSSAGLEPFEWTAGCVVRVFRKKRKPRLGAKDPISHTARMFDVPKENLDVTAWGPYHSEMSAHIKESLLRKDDRQTVLIGTGSGVGYVLDVLQWKKEYAPKRQIKILFSTRDAELFKWVKDTIEPFAITPEITIHLAFTGTHIDLEEDRIVANKCEKIEFDFVNENEEIESVNTSVNESPTTEPVNENKEMETITGSNDESATTVNESPTTEPVNENKEMETVTGSNDESATSYPLNDTKESESINGSGNDPATRNILNVNEESESVHGSDSKTATTDLLNVNEESESVNGSHNKSATMILVNENREIESDDESDTTYYTTMSRRSCLTTVSGQSCLTTVSGRSSQSSPIQNVIISYWHHDFDKEIEEESIVFSQGSQGLNEHVAKICAGKKAKFYGGLQSTERFEMFDALIESSLRSLNSLRTSIRGSSVRSLTAMRRSVKTIRRSFQA